MKIKLLIIALCAILPSLKASDQFLHEICSKQQPSQMQPNNNSQPTSSFFDEDVKKKSYPFVTHPNLSWHEFEKNFRQKYPELNIPYISTWAAGAGPQYRRETKSIEVDYDYLQKFECSPEITEFWLLHETGHHIFGEQRKAANELQAQENSTYNSN